MLFFSFSPLRAIWTRPLSRQPQAPPLPSRAPGLLARFRGPAPRAPPPSVLPAQTRGLLCRGRVAGLRRLGRCPSPPRLQLWEEPFPGRRGDAGEPAAEGPLRERASSCAHHGAGGARGLGPQPRRARPAGEAVALLALVKTDPRAGCREGGGQGRPNLGGAGIFSNPGFPLPVAVPQSGWRAELVPAQGSGVKLAPPWAPFTAFPRGFLAFSSPNPTKIGSFRT